MSLPKSMVKVRIAGGRTSIYTNWNDKRGRWLARRKGMTQPLLTRGWRKAVETVQPTMVLDIGLNYGEILYSAKYKKETRIFGIEANKDLAPYIQTSLSRHPNKKQIKIIYALASDQQKKKAKFYIDPVFSGTSSAARGITANDCKKQRIRSIVVENLFSGIRLRRHRFLFKIDVEGFEGHVLRGMTRLIRKSAGTMGWIEFNNIHLSKAGTNVEEFSRFLGEHFHVYYPTADELIHFKPFDYATISRYFDNREMIHANLLLATGKKMVSRLGYPIRRYPSP